MADLYELGEEVLVDVPACPTQHVVRQERLSRLYGVWCMVKLCRLVACSCEFGFINTGAVIG